MIKINQMKTPKVTFMAPNQVIIHTPEGRFFQSYDSIITFISRSGRVTLDEKYWDYSRITGKYRNQFLGEDKKTTEKKIQSEFYKLDNLNK